MRSAAASPGLSRLEQGLGRLDRPLHGLGRRPAAAQLAVRAVERGRHAVADRLRKPREPDAGARHVARARGGRPRIARRRTGTPRPAIPYRKVVLAAAGGIAGIGVGYAFMRLLTIMLPPFYPARRRQRRHGHAPAGVRVRAVGRDRADLRPRTRPAGDEAGSGECDERRRPRQFRRYRPPAALAARSSSSKSRWPSSSSPAEDCWCAASSR